MPIAGKMSEKRAATRARLLEATLAMIAEGGLHGVSVDGVARRAGVTKGAVYDNFESKDAMIVAAFAGLPDDATGPFVWPKGREGSVGERLRRLGEAIFDGRGDVQRSALGSVEFTLYALTHPEMRDRLKEIASMGPTRTTERLHELFAEEELAVPIDAFALFIHTFAPGLAQYRAVAPRPPSRETVAAIFMSFQRGDLKPLGS